MSTPDDSPAQERQRLLTAQLEQAYESARAIASSTLQIMTIAAAGEVAAVTIA